MIKVKRLTCYMLTNTYINIFGMLHYFLVALDCFSLKLRMFSDLSKNAWKSKRFLSCFFFTIEVNHCTLASSIVISSYGVTFWLLQSVNKKQNEYFCVWMMALKSWICCVDIFNPSSFYLLSNSQERKRTTKVWDKTSLPAELETSLDTDFSGLRSSLAASWAILSE